MNRDQLKTILWLRWRLTRNQWAKGGGIGAVIAAIVAIGMVVLSIASVIVAVSAGLFLPPDTKPDILMAIWFGLTVGFLFIWLVGLISELQRSESIDLQRLMHLPVALGQIFVINYAASHLAMSIAVFVPAVIGLSIGLAISRSPAMLLMIPLALGMIFMITAWTYCLRGWLATLMSNPRRRRAVIMGVTTAFVVLAQAPNLYFNVIRRADRPSKAERRSETPEQRAAREDKEEAEFSRLAEWQVAIPPLWVPVGAKALAEGRPLPALFGTFGVIAIGALGLRRAYRSTLRFYQGETGGKASARAPARRAPAAAGAAGAAVASGPVKEGVAFLERTLPGVPEQAAAVALATLKSMLRAPEVKMQWGTSFVVTLLVGAPLLFRASSSLPEAAKPFVATGVVVFSMFLMVGFVANQFGFDRDGFRAFVLSPADRRLVLIGKNLAALPAAAVSSTVLLTMVTIWLRLSPLVYVAALLQLMVGLLLAAMVGNLLSILVPYRIQPGSMRPTKLPGLAMLVLVLSQMSLPLALTPAFVPPLVGYLSQRVGGPPAAIVNLTLSLILALAMAFAYRQALPPLGRLLSRRETKILATVSVDVE
jgi:ABC-2 type transport system permease protein